MVSWSLLCFLCIYKRTELEIEWLNCSKQKRKTQVCCLVGPLPAKHVATWGQVFHAVVTSVACFGVAHGGFARHGIQISLLVATPRQKILHQKKQTVKLWLGFRQVFDKGVHSPKEGNSLPKIQTLGWIDSNTRLRINFALWRDEGLWDAPLFCSAAPYADDSLIVLFIYRHRFSQRVPADVRIFCFLLSSLHSRFWTNNNQNSLPKCYVWQTRLRRCCILLHLSWISFVPIFQTSKNTCVFISSSNNS